MTVLNDRIDVENRLLHRHRDHLLEPRPGRDPSRDDRARPGGDSGGGRLPPSVEPRAGAPHVARGLRRLRGRRGTRHASHGGGHRGMGGGAPRRSSSSRRTSPPTLATSTSPSCAARSSPRCSRSRSSRDPASSWARSTCMGESAAISRRATSSSCAARPRSSPPRSSMRTSFERSRGRRLPSGTSCWRCSGSSI
jgi:hypothetical protein